jgi:hypothetical protein
MQEIIRIRYGLLLSCEHLSFWFSETTKSRTTNTNTNRCISLNFKAGNRAIFLSTKVDVNIL